MYKIWCCQRVCLGRSFTRLPLHSLLLPHLQKQCPLAPSVESQYTSVSVYSRTPSMRTPPLIRILQPVPRVSGIEGFHCMYVACTGMSLCEVDWPFLAISLVWLYSHIPHVYVYLQCMWLYMYEYVHVYVCMWVDLLMAVATCIHNTCMCHSTAVQACECTNVWSCYDCWLAVGTGSLCVTCSVCECVCVCVCVCAFVVRHCNPSQPLDSEKNLQFDHSLPTLQHFCIQTNLINELFPPGQQIRLSLVHVHVPISCAVV